MPPLVYFFIQYLRIWKWHSHHLWLIFKLLFPKSFSNSSISLFISAILFSFVNMLSTKILFNVSLLFFDIMISPMIRFFFFSFQKAFPCYVSSIFNFFSNCSTSFFLVSISFSRSNKNLTFSLSSLSFTF